jgi:Bacterial archaeo-eukaryotic release factor family 10
MATFSPLLSLFTRAPRLRLASGRALSVYVPAPKSYDAHLYDLEFTHLLKRFSGRFGHEDRDVVEHELPRLRAHMSVVRPAGCPAVAGFSDEAGGVLELINLRAPTDTRLEVGELLLAPILRQLEQFPPAVVAVVDKEEAVTFGFFLEDLSPLEHMVGAEVRHSRAGNTSALSNQRRADNRARTNLEIAARTVEQEMDSGAYKALYLAGPQEARAEFERMLPRPLRGLIAGHLGASIDSPRLEHELREKLAANLV